MPFTEEAWFKAYPHDVKTSIIRLFKKSNLIELKTEITDELIYRVTTAYDFVLRRTLEWDKKTQRERGIWIDKFEKASKSFLDLAKEGPIPLESWGFPIRDYVLVQTAEKLGTKVPEKNDINSLFKLMLKLEMSINEIDWNLGDSIRHYIECAKTDAAHPQALSKPRDEKSTRALLIINLKKNSNLSSSDIALISSILLNDESIDDRLVRRITSNR